MHATAFPALVIRPQKHKKQTTPTHTKLQIFVECILHVYISCMLN